MKKNGRPLLYNEELQEKFENMVSNFKPELFFDFADMNQISYQLGISKETFKYWIKRYKKYKDKKYKPFYQTYTFWKTKRNAFLVKLIPTMSKKMPGVNIFLMKVMLGYLEVPQKTNQNLVRPKDTPNIEKENPKESPKLDLVPTRRRRRKLM